MDRVAPRAGSRDLHGVRPTTIRDRRAATARRPRATPRATSSSSCACAIAVSDSSRPASIRDSSRTRPASSSALRPEVVTEPSLALRDDDVPVGERRHLGQVRHDDHLRATWPAPPAGGRSRPRPCRRRPASTSSKTNVGTGRVSASATSSASITRDSSPPEAPLRQRPRLGARCWRPAAARPRRPRWRVNRQRAGRRSRGRCVVLDAAAEADRRTARAASTASAAPSVTVAGQPLARPSRRSRGQLGGVARPGVARAAALPLGAQLLDPLVGARRG